MRRHILFILLIVVLLVFLLNTPYLFERLFPKMLESRFAGLEVETFKIGRQRFRFPNKIVFEDVALHFRRGEGHYRCSARGVVLYQLINLMDSQSRSRIDLKGMDIQAPAFMVSKMNMRATVSLRAQAPGQLNAVLNGATIAVGDYRVTDVSARLRGNEAKVLFSEVSGNGYGGIFQGQVSFDLKPYFHYVVWLEGYDLLPDALKDFHPLLEFLSGNLDGTFRVVGQERAIEILAVSLEVKKGGISKELFLKLLPFISDKELRPAFDGFFELHDALPVDQASFHLQSPDASRSRRGTLYFSIVNKDYGLKIREILNVDMGGLLEMIFPERI